MEYFNRRKFMKTTAASMAGIVLPFGSPAAVGDGPGTPAGVSKGFDLMQEVMKYPKLDAHVHVYLGKAGPEDNVRFFERLGFTRMFISRPVTAGIDSGKGTPDEFRRSNDIVYQCVKKYPDKLTGMFTLNPEHAKESLEEIKRSVDRGMVGLKVYHQVKINNPLFYPVIEKMIDLKMIILMHAEATLGVAGYRMKYDKGIRPQASLPEDFADVAKRYPEALFQYAHIGGGTDWEYACKILRHSPNVYLDTSGSNNEEHMIDFAVKEVGIDRLLFGSDNMFYQSIGKVLCSGLTDAQKRKLFFENYNTILKKGGYHVDRL
ncbi:amidohydrolase family protein [Niabella beijingensis]|uniref:amidohydrolase family protein n=1 Tax=Niabella beijingensis TaxID=2872700 RepID=UPI001CBCD0E3|nr:amidohydrolase family protein [Niabella beijingensis]MBZ4191175.1 amidohydrolase family protein [Niabella beijingensis]